MILEKYVTRMHEKDATGIVELFAEDCEFNDYAGRPFGIPDIEVKGREGVLRLFQNFLGNHEVKAEIVKLGESSVEYNVTVGDMLTPCVGTATLKNGLISQYIVHPRQDGVVNT